MFENTTADECGPSIDENDVDDEDDESSMNSLSDLTEVIEEELMTKSVELLRERETPASAEGGCHIASELLESWWAACNALRCNRLCDTELRLVVRLNASPFALQTR